MTPEEKAARPSDEAFALIAACAAAHFYDGLCAECVDAALRTAREGAEAAINMKLFNESIAQVRREERCFFLDALMDIADALGCGKHPEGHVDRAKEIVHEALDRARAQEQP